MAKKLKKSEEAQIVGYKVFFLEREYDSENNALNMKTKSKIIPAELKDRFLEQFGENSLINIQEKDINEFLEKNSK